MIKTMDELLQKAAEKKECTIAVAAAHDAEVIDAVVRADDMDIAVPILVGKGSEIDALLAVAGRKNRYEVIDAESDTEAAAKAVQLARSGRAQCLMKGILSTADMMRAVINKETGLRTGRLMSSIMLYTMPLYSKMLLLTDGGLNVAPDLEQKAQILENGAEVLKKLGYDKIYASCICGAEAVNPKIPALVDAAALAGMKDRWTKYNMDVIGPVGLDLAVSPAACKHKHYSAPGCGETDILLLPTYEVGNALGKAFTYFGQARSAGFIAGAAVPLVLASRADTADNKLASIAAGILVG